MRAVGNVIRKYWKAIVLLAALSAATAIAIRWPQAFGMAVVTGVVCSPVALLVRAEVFMRQSRGKIAAIVSGAGPGDIGTLLKLLDDDDKHVRSAARDALVLLLPALSEEEAEAAFYRDHARAMARIVESDSRAVENRPLIVAILAALVAFGGEPFLAPVERLAFGRGPGPDPEIAAAAAHCLPYLSQRAKQQQSHSALLRGASAPTLPDAGDLVRAASSAYGPNPADLLRPGEG